ncbi:hypothetical protein IWW34DRAFT_597196, partial [Fusarium oxysporum f. sp. albedinis]
ASDEEAKQRKKVQNRLYKRASSDMSKTRDARCNYQVNRWRLDEFGASRPPRPLRPPKGSTAAPDTTAQTRTEESSSVATRNQELWFPLPIDHLIHLVKYNVFRGLWKNKFMVDSLTVPYCAPGPSIDTSFAFPRYSSILPKTPEYRGSLAPTQVQMSLNHFSWIDCLPCPIMRENLISHEFNFSHVDFLRDLVGTLINLDLFKAPILPMSTNRGNLAGDQDTVAAGSGLILWGEPHLIDSWEIIPDFLLKWGWTIMNCQGLVNSTNHWRMSRGETPLLL